MSGFARVDLESLFQHYCNLVPTLSGTVSNDTLLACYCLYKHITIPGLLDVDSPNYIGARPSFFNPTARAKYDAVVSEGSKDRGGKEGRMVEYIKIVDDCAGLSEVEGENSRGQMRACSPMSPPPHPHSGRLLPTMCLVS